MMDWSLPTTGKIERTRPSGASKNRRGFWRLFLSKYPESGRMYAKMTMVSEMARRPEEERVRREALRELWGGQCNDAYWHGVFGGLYSATLRRITYHHLLRAQSTVELALHEEESAWIETSQRSINGHKELVVDTSSIGVSISPDIGGAVTEFDVKEIATNLLDTLQRREEKYHAEIGKVGSNRPKSRGSIAPASGSGKKKETRSVRATGGSAPGAPLVYDRLPKFSFLDFFLESRTSATNILSQNYREKAPLAGRNYDLEVQPRTDVLVAQLSRNCATFDGQSRVSLRKRLSVPRKESSIQLDYDFRVEPSNEKEGGEGILAIETNLSSLGDARFIKANSEPRSLQGTSSYRLEYPQMGLGVLLELSEPSGIWIVPVNTVSRSEAGYESNLQGISVIPYFRIPEAGRYGFSMRMLYLAGDTERR
jgi:alpha-amylase